MGHLVRIWNQPVATGMKLSTSEKVSAEYLFVE